MCKLSQKAVDDILERGRIYEVGGAVRDRLLMKTATPKDRDYLVTGIPIDELTQILKTHGRVDLVGKSFGVIKLTQFRALRAYTFDVTLPRSEHSTGSGHKDFQVEFDPGLKVEEDLRRRDFTLNAMALALDNNELIDPLGGRADIENRFIRMTSRASFHEDPLRMLRAVQFAARFEFMIEPETYRELRERASLIATVSSERINEELNKLLLLAEKPSDGFRLLQSSGLLKEILPELDKCVGVDQPGGYHRYDVFEHTIRTIDACPPNLRLRLAALFHDIRKPQAKRIVDKGATFYGHETAGAHAAKETLRRLKYPQELTSQVALLVERHMFTTDVGDKGLRRLIRRTGTELIFDLLDLRRADVIAQGMGGTTEDVDEFEKNIQREIDSKAPFGLKDLAIDGQDIMQILDIKPNKSVGMVLEYLLEKVLDDPSLNTKEALESLTREIDLNNLKNSSGRSYEEDSR